MEREGPGGTGPEMIPKKVPERDKESEPHKVPKLDNIPASDNAPMTPEDRKINEEQLLKKIGTPAMNVPAIKNNIINTMKKLGQQEESKFNKDTPTPTGVQPKPNAAGSFNDLDKAEVQRAAKSWKNKTPPEKASTNTTTTSSLAKKGMNVREMPKVPIPVVPSPGAKPSTSSPNPFSTKPNPQK